MNGHKCLLSIQSKLTSYFSYFKEDSVLVVSEDKATLPFMYIIYDSSHPKELLISIAVDYPAAVNVAEILCKASKVTKISLSDSFYISIDGSTYFNKEANDRWTLDCLDLNDLKPLSDAIN